MISGSKYYLQFSTNPVERQRVQNIVEPDNLGKIKAELAWMPGKSRDSDDFAKKVDEDVIYGGKIKM